MLVSSNIHFNDNCKQIVIEYDTKHLDSSVLDPLLKKSNSYVDFVFDRGKLHLLDRDQKYQIALLYNVDEVDHRVGWLLKKMCITNENFGFIITPMIRWYRHRTIELYQSIISNRCEAYFDLTKIDKGIISLVIDYNLNDR